MLVIVVRHALACTARTILVSPHILTSPLPHLQHWERKPPILSSGRRRCCLRKASSSTRCIHLLELALYSRRSPWLGVRCCQWSIGRRGSLDGGAVCFSRFDLPFLDFYTTRTYKLIRFSGKRSAMAVLPFAEQLSQLLTFQMVRMESNMIFNKSRYEIITVIVTFLIANGDILS